LEGRIRPVDQQAAAVEAGIGIAAAGEPRQDDV
jgi:hypothetical protein